MSIARQVLKITLFWQFYWIPLFFCAILLIDFLTNWHRTLPAWQQLTGKEQGDVSLR